MNTLKINGTTLTGIYVDAAVSFNKPAKRVSEYSIPGRNGNLVIDEGTFDNVLISYPVYEKNTFPTEFDNLVNWLASLEGYQRIECSNDPQHYRLGRFVVPETPTAKRLNKDGYYTLVFDCKPQRYLLSGEVETEITNAEVVIASDSEPYLFRKSGGAQDITGADRLDLKAVTGGTVAWNQLIKDSSVVSNGVTTTLSNGVRTLSNAVTQNWCAIASNEIGYKSGHVYASLVWLYANPNSLTFNFSTLGGASVNPTFNVHSISAIGSYGTIRKSSIDVTSNTSLGLAELTANTDLSGIKLSAILIDLTQLFGSTIADYLYTLEQNTAGAGVAWFKKLFPKPYYAYDAGSLQSVNASEHGTVGINQWDEQWELGQIYTDGTISTSLNRIVTKNYIPVLPNTTYCLSIPYNSRGRAAFYDASKNLVRYFNDFPTGTISAVGSRYYATFTTPSGACYMKYNMVAAYGTTYNHDICINLSKPTGTPKNGDYVPYEAHTYALDSSLTLRGIPKLDANNNLYYDGDTYESDGKVTRKYGIRAYASGDATDGSTMITDGTNTVYKLTTPTEETAEGYTNPQVVDVDGTEEYTDYGVEQGTRDVAIPVGHSTDYFNQLGYIITNPTYFKSKPKIRVYGSGTFTVDNMTITVAAHSQPYIDIDSETETCEYDGTNMSQYVTLSSNDYPELAAGQNGIMPTPGITKLGVTPRWWIL